MTQSEASFETVTSYYRAHVTLRNCQFLKLITKSALSFRSVKKLKNTLRRDRSMLLTCESTSARARALDDDAYARRGPRRFAFLFHCRAQDFPRCFFFFSAGGGSYTTYFLSAPQTSAVRPSGHTDVAFIDCNRPSP